MEYTKPSVCGGKAVTRGGCVIANIMASSFNANMLLPGWWIKAFDTALLSENQGLTAMDHAYRSGLAPALTMLEMSGLAMVLTSLQQQILTEKSGYKLTVRSDEHLKHAGTAMRSRRFVFEKVMQMLTGLRLLQPEKGGAFCSHAPFPRDSWRKISDDGDFEVTLTEGPLAPEFILGLSDLHLDFIRRVEGKTTGVEAIGDRPPLAAWRSVWLDLQGVEQIVHLRMERAMQWDFNWLQLEGIFGLSVKDLFSGIDLPHQRGSELDSELVKQVRLIHRMGKRLEAHGFLNPAVSKEYLAFSKSNCPSLVWQVSRERLLSRAVSEYRTACGTYFVKQRFHLFADLMTKAILMANAEPALITKAHETWLKIADSGIVTDFNSWSQLPGIAQSQTFLSPLLFFELLLRKVPGAKWPLPEICLVAPLNGVLRDADINNPEAITAQFKLFDQILNEQSGLAAEFLEIPFATLGSEVTLKEADFSQVSGFLRHSPQLAPARVEVRATPDPGQIPAKKAVTPPSQQAVNGRMLKAALDELTKMKVKDPARYQAMKQKYLESLDEEGRRLMLDVQKRIQPVLFEEQLRQRLVRYMVDNPASWHSAEHAKIGTI